jgi:hypothetical protein
MASIGDAAASLLEFQNNLQKLHSTGCITKAELKMGIEKKKKELKALIRGEPLPEDGEMGSNGGAQGPTPGNRNEAASGKPFPCSKLEACAVVCTFPSFNAGRVAVAQALTEQTLFEGQDIGVHSLTPRCKGKKSGSGVPARGIMDWEFTNGYALRWICMILHDTDHDTTCHTTWAFACDTSWYLTDTGRYFFVFNAARWTIPHDTARYLTILLRERTIRGRYYTILLDTLWYTLMLNWYSNMLPLVYRLVATTRVPEKKKGRGKKKEEPVKVVIYAIL